MVGLIMKRKELIELLESIRIDVITGDNIEYNQDELGAILSILGVESYKEIYGLSIIKDNALTSEDIEALKKFIPEGAEEKAILENILNSY